MDKPVSPFPTRRTLPANVPVEIRTVYDYFLWRFDKVPAAVWQSRFARGLVTSTEGAVGVATLYRPGLEVHYLREGRGAEPPVRWDWSIVYEDDDLLVADKPHFLPVMPSGRYVSRCLVTALRLALNKPDLVPLHRLDRDTAGLVAFSKRQATRGPLALMFVPGRIRKEYRALCEIRTDSTSRHALITGHLEVEIPYWKRRLAPDLPANSETEILRIATKNGLAYYKVTPRTGKTHQIRVHLASIGLPILNDRIYADNQEPDGNLISRPLQLQAFRLDFIHPLNGKPLTVKSNLRLAGLRLF